MCWTYFAHPLVELGRTTGSRTLLSIVVIVRLNGAKILDINSC